MTLNRHHLRDLILNLKFEQDKRRNRLPLMNFFAFRPFRNPTFFCVKPVPRKNFHYYRSQQKFQIFFEFNIICCNTQIRSSEKKLDETFLPEDAPGQGTLDRDFFDSLFKLKLKIINDIQNLFPKFKLKISKFKRSKFEIQIKN